MLKLVSFLINIHSLDRPDRFRQNTETDQTQELLDEIKRLRLLLAEKDSVILELQRALESQKREQCDSLASSPSMPAGLDKLSSGGGAKTVRAPSPLRNESRRGKQRYSS